MEPNANQSASKPLTPPSPSGKSNLYPEFSVPNNQKPNRLLAFPFFGIAAKALALIPVFVFAFFLGIWWFITLLIVPFVILFTGKYWDPAYQATLAYMRYLTKLILFLYGISDKYPGFNLDESNIFSLTYEKPTVSNRLLGFPLLGFLIRLILLIPYAIYESVLQKGSSAAVFFSWFAVLFTGRYPESLYEFNRDYLRVGMAAIIYLSYLSDSYPSFTISMNHKIVKIILLILGTLFFITSLLPSQQTHRPTQSMYNYPNQTVNYTH